MAVGKVEFKEDETKVWIVNAGRLLSDEHYCTSSQCGEKWSGRTEWEPITAPGHPLRIREPLDSLDSRDPLDNQDPLNIQNRWLLTLPFALRDSILLPGPILPPHRMQHSSFAIPSLQVLGFALLWCNLFRFALPLWETPLEDCVVAGCRVWMSTTHRKSGLDQFGRSGTTAQCMTWTESSAAMLMNIQCRFLISRQDLGLSMGRSRRMYVYWAGIVWRSAAYHISPVGFQSPSVGRKWNLLSRTKTSQQSPNLTGTKISRIRCSLFWSILFLMPMAVGFRPQLGESFVDSSVSNGSSRLLKFRVRIGTGTEQFHGVIPHEIPSHCNWASSTTIIWAFQPHNPRSN